MARPRFGCLALAMAAGLVLPSSASAGYVSAGNLTFRALAGERNDVRVSLQSRSGETVRLLVEDRGAPILLSNPDPAAPVGDPTGCVHVPGSSGKRMVCPMHADARVNLYLGDRNDAGSTAGLPKDIESSLFGEAGNDTLSAGLSNDRITGGRGRDTVSYANAKSRGVIVDLRKHRAWGALGTDRLRSIENARSGRGNDVLAGTGGRNTLDGSAGNDLIFGRGGADRLIGGRGADVIGADDGRRDRVLCGAGRDGVEADRRDRLTSCETIRFR